MTLTLEEARSLGRIESGIESLQKTLDERTASVNARLDRDDKRLNTIETKAHVMTGVLSVFIAIFAMFHVDLLSLLRK